MFNLRQLTFPTKILRYSYRFSRQKAMRLRLAGTRREKKKKKEKKKFSFKYLYRLCLCTARCVLWIVRANIIVAHSRNKFLLFFLLIFRLVRFLSSLQLIYLANYWFNGRFDDSIASWHFEIDRVEYMKFKDIASVCFPVSYSLFHANQTIIINNVWNNSRWNAKWAIIFSIDFIRSDNVPKVQVEQLKNAHYTRIINYRGYFFGIFIFVIFTMNAIGLS